ncbi:MAG: hypothetical protein MR051_02640 [Lentisphaeria bacterium]|nr:hypothetical protein [Lentisphaeria bacterium]
MKAEEVTSRDIEQALAWAGDRFTVAGVVKHLIGGKSEPLRRRVERAVESDDRFFYDGKWSCRTRSGFFAGRRFLITPDDWEIANGVLFPGHRFVPFVADEVFPSAVKLREKGGAEIGEKKLILPLGTVFHYHILLGSEQIFDFMLADDPANSSLRTRAGRTDAVTLTVFDMAEFFRRNSFAAGDALLCTVEDYTAGVVSFEYLSAASRPAAARSAYIAALEEGAAAVWRKFQDYPDIPEQLAWIMFLSPVPGDAPGASLDEFMARSAKVQLRPEGDHAVLTVPGEDDTGYDDGHCNCGGHDHDHGSELPAGLALTESEIDDPLKLLSEAGFPLSPAELDGFMLDAIYGRESEFDGVRSRVFGHAEFDFDDEVKQAVLLNFLEERFETLRDNYNRADDESKAELRSQIMESVSRRLDYLAALGAAEHDPGEAEKERMRRLADVAAKLGEALRLLNHPGFTPDRRELDRLGELIDDQISRQEEIIGDTEADQ